MIRERAHKALGNSEICGMKTIALMFKELERMDKENRFENVGEICGEVCTAFVEISRQCEEMYLETVA